MTENLPAYRKTLTAVVGALLTWATVVVTSEPSRITASEWLLLGGSMATALGVYATRNEVATDDGGQSTDDGGQSTLDLVIKIAVAIIVVIVAWWFISGLVSDTPHG